MGHIPRTLLVLALSLSFLLFGTGMAGAAPHACGMAAGHHGGPSHGGTGRCCCPGEHGKPCSDVAAQCGQHAKNPASVSKTEGCALAIGPTFTTLSLPPFFGEDAPRSVFGREIIYLLNLNILC